MKRSPFTYAAPDPLAELLDGIPEAGPVYTITATTDLPARLFGGNAQAVEVSGLDYTLHLDLSKLPESEVPTSNDNKWTVVWDQAANLYKRVEFTSLPGGVGPKGDQGDQGIPGTKGDKGDQGVAGPPGATGTQGIQGPPGATGTQGIQGPAGPVGPAGPTGATGPTGPAGAGITDGDKGDIVVSASGATWMFDSTVVTAVAKTVLDDATVGAMRITLGLGAVDNTSDVAKPVSTAQQTALNLKADIASPVFTGDPKAPTPATADNDTSIATTAYVKAQGYAAGTHTHAESDITNLVSDLAAKAPLASPTFTGTVTAPNYNLTAGGGLVNASGANMYTVVKDGSSNDALIAGGTGFPQNFYRNTTHSFEDRAGSVSWLVLSATQLLVKPTTASTSTNTGSLVVLGGVGIAGTLYVGGQVNASGKNLVPTISTSAPSGGVDGDVWYQVP